MVTSSSSVSKSPQSLSTSSVFPPPNTTLSKTTTAYISSSVSFPWNPIGIQNKTNIKILRNQTKVPLIIDAGIGQASDAVQAMEMGCDAVLINTAIAKAKNPFKMADAMKHAVISGRMSFLSGRITPNIHGAPSTTKDGLI